MVSDTHMKAKYEGQSNSELRPVLLPHLLQCNTAGLPMPAGTGPKGEAGPDSPWPSSPPIYGLLHAVTSHASLAMGTSYSQPQYCPPGFLHVRELSSEVAL